jgi:imidazolonepropionase
MTRPPEPLLLRNVGVLVTCDPQLGEGPLGLIPDAAVLCRGGRIEYAGPASGLPEMGAQEPVTLDLDGHLVTPGLIDCHTHLVYAGDRLDDFEARLRGESYGAVSERGGGILSTVAATRAASDAVLLDLAEARVEHMVSGGVTTIEVKSGYGLDTRHELRLLETIRQADRRCIAELIPTFLGAHTFPVSARRSVAARRAYVDLVVDDMLPAVARDKLARFCDVFIEDGAFSLDEGRRILVKAKELGLGLKVHAEQITYTGAAELAAELGAVSAEHLEQVSDEGLAKMAAAGTVAVLLPGAATVLRDKMVDAARLRKAGVAMAVATDMNPGTSPTHNLLLMVQLAVLGSGMTMDEGLLSVTAVAARAIGLGDDRGRIRAGLRADLALFRARDPRELLYYLGAGLCSGVVKTGHYHRIEAARPGRIRPWQLGS